MRIVDDDPAIREALLDLLSSVGLETQEFSNANDLLNDHHLHRPGCIILDLRLPGLSGLDFQRRLEHAAGLDWRRVRTVPMNGVRPTGTTQTPAEMTANVSRHLMQVTVERLGLILEGFRDFREI